MSGKPLFFSEKVLSYDLCVVVVGFMFVFVCYDCGVLRLCAFLFAFVFVLLGVVCVCVGVFVVVCMCVCSCVRCGLESGISQELRHMNTYNLTFELHHQALVMML